jgi:hypothetical protein
LLLPVGVVVVEVPGTVGAVVSISTVPFEVYALAVPRASVALTRKYQVPSARPTECVYEFVFVVSVFASQPVNPELPHHMTVYAGLARPEPASVDAVHVQTGLLLFVGLLAVIGVPGSEGAVTSTNTEPTGEYALEFPATSVAFTRKYHVPSARFTECVYEFVVEVALFTPLEKDELSDHWIEYAGFASVEPASVDTVHVQVGTAVADGVVVEGVPGTVGVVLSILTVFAALLIASLFPALSFEKYLIVYTPSSIRTILVP